MKLSELIEEFIEMKIEGEPEATEWRYFDADTEARMRWRDRLRELRNAIDEAIRARGN